MARIRIQRMESELLKLINNVVNFKMDDRNLQMINISSVKLANDLSQAKVYFTCLNEADQKRILETLNKSKGFIRREIAAANFMRTVPNLIFYYDDTEDNARHLDEIFARIQAEEKKIK